ncbi:hypothetical protein [Actinomadura rugatobispora]|uniref:Hydrogenase maturation nickel metallochaperone HypA n=1 Tax=Actinomadura rugatobispora TaxID=1994 RepID=A0ABW1A4Z0_9ACTN|nr:hypothetical protein GCM10010200_013980 [Actinomadura rugatobispora]
MEDGDVLQAAEALRRFLPELAGDAAPGLDRELGELLERGRAGESVKVPLLRLLSGHEATRDWMRRALEVPQKYRTFQPQAGRVRLSAVRYACPRCGTEWYRFSVLDEVPSCPDDEVPFEPVTDR